MLLLPLVLHLTSSTTPLLFSLPSTSLPATYNCTSLQLPLTSLLHAAYLQFWVATGGHTLPPPRVLLPRCYTEHTFHLVLPCRPLFRLLCRQLLPCPLPCSLPPGPCARAWPCSARLPTRTCSSPPHPPQTPPPQGTCSTEGVVLEGGGWSTGWSGGRRWRGRWVRRS